MTFGFINSDFNLIFSLNVLVTCVVHNWRVKPSIQCAISSLLSDFVSIWFCSYKCIVTRLYSMCSICRTCLVFLMFSSEICCHVYCLFLIVVGACTVVYALNFYALSFICILFQMHCFLSTLCNMDFVVHRTLYALLFFAL